MFSLVVGRGAPYCFYIGNIHFRDLVGTRKTEFMGTGRHAIKGDIAEQIYSMIQSKNGRFLREIKNGKIKAGSFGLPDHTRMFAEVNKADALRKIKQSLREDGSKVSTTGRRAVKVYLDKEAPSLSTPHDTSNETLLMDSPLAANAEMTLSSAVTLSPTNVMDYYHFEEELQTRFKKLLETQRLLDRAVFSEAISAARNYCPCTFALAQATYGVPNQPALPLMQSFSSFPVAGFPRLPSMGHATHGVCLPN